MNKKIYVLNNKQIEPIPKSSINKRCLILTVCLVALVTMLIVGLVLVLSDVLNEYKINYESLIDQEPLDMDYNVTECGKTFYAPSLYPDGLDAIETKIINGAEAVANSFPWTVSLRRFNNNRISVHVCGGTIIGEQAILTAGHCLTDVRPDELVIVTGLHQIDKILYKTQVYFPSKIVTLYKPKNVTLDDIALIKLNRIILTGKKVAPICLTTDQASTNTFLNRKLLAIGWGDMKAAEKKSKYPDKLQQTIRVVTNNVSRCTLDGLISWSSRSAYCTESKPFDTLTSLCLGDSGNFLFGRFLFNCNGVF